MAFTQEEINIIHKQVVNELAKEIRSIQQLHQTNDTVDIQDVMASAADDGYTTNPETVFLRKNERKELSIEAKAVLAVLEEYPDAILNHQQRPTKSALRQYLIDELKWVEQTVAQVFVELTAWTRLL